jgi:hypothetical protein
VRRSSRRETGDLDGWSPSTKSGLQACYGKSLGDGAFSMVLIRRRLLGLVRGARRDFYGREFQAVVGGVPACANRLR